VLEDPGDLEYWYLSPAIELLGFTPLLLCPFFDLVSYGSPSGLFGKKKKTTGDEENVDLKSWALVASPSMSRTRSRTGPKLMATLPLPAGLASSDLNKSIIPQRDLHWGLENKEPGIWDEPFFEMRLNDIVRTSTVIQRKILKAMKEPLPKSNPSSALSGSRSSTS